MSRSLPHDDPPLIKLIRYGILGGLAATPVSIVFRDFPADLLSQLWGAVVKVLPPGTVVEAWSHADIQRLRRDPHLARVVLVYGGDGRVLSSSVADWLVEIRRGGNKPLPAILSTHHRTSTDTPGATLIAQGNDDLYDELDLWLQQENPLLELPDEEPTSVVSIDAGQLQRAIRQAAERRSISVRDIHIVTGLVTGIVINDALTDWPFEQPLQEPGPSHYAEAYELLNTRPFHTIEQPHDDLTIHMLARANAYLRNDSDKTAVKSTRLGGRAGSTSTLQVNKNKPDAGEIPRHITRRELVDLGNPNSSISKKLIEGLVQNVDSETLKLIGVEATGRSRLSPRIEKPDASKLLKSMTTWTYKMVRTRFDRLLSEGLIEARKAADNAALEYIVPEVIGNGRSVFAHLPDPKEVKAIYDLTAQPAHRLPLSVGKPNS